MIAPSQTTWREAQRAERKSTHDCARINQVLRMKVHKSKADILKH
jgi:hypothetical protein